MKSVRSLRNAALGIAALAWSSQAAAVLIDFETDAGGTPIVPEVSLLDQYASLGVVFSATEDGAAVDPTIQGPDVFFDETAFSGTNFASNQIAGFGPNDGDNRADVFTMSFPGLASGVSFYVDPNGGSIPEFNAYDAADNLLESIAVDSDGWVQIAFSSINISRIEGIQPTDRWNYGVDDLAFNTTTSVPVPAPATLLLLGIGLLGIGWRHRQRIS